MLGTILHNIGFILWEVLFLLIRIVLVTFA